MPTAAMSTLLRRETPLRWVFTGDSVTQGALHTYDRRDYVELFEEELRWTRGRSRDHVINTAVSGRRIDDVERDLAWSALQYRPDIASLMIGINDAIQSTEVAAFNQSLVAVVSELRAAGAFVVLQTPNGIAAQGADGSAVDLLPYVDAIRATAADLDVVLVDHHAAWSASGAARLGDWLADDVHPDALGHGRLFETLVAEFALENRMA